MKKNPETLYVAHYRTNNGNKVRGNWYTSESAVNEEVARYKKYPLRREFTWESISKIPFSEVEKIAFEHNCTVQDVLS